MNKQVNTQTKILSSDKITSEYVIQAIQSYPGAMVIISHDEDFLDHIDYDVMYTIAKGNLQQKH